jgi:hypothetical protein
VHGHLQHCASLASQTYPRAHQVATLDTEKPVNNPTDYFFWSAAILIVAQYLDQPRELVKLEIRFALARSNDRRILDIPVSRK